MFLPHVLPSPTLLVDEAIDHAVSRIAPAWPLDRQIAVNPLWGHVDRPLPEVARDLASSSGATLTMPRRWYLERWTSGAFTDAHVTSALAVTGSRRTVAEVRAALAAEPGAPLRRPLVTDVRDAQGGPTELPWRDRVVHAVSAWCAAWLDEDQAHHSPRGDGGLYADWRTLTDAVPLGFMPATSRRWRARLAQLPVDPRAAIAAALAELDVPPERHADYLGALLEDVGGWAAVCAHRRFTARQGGGDDDTLVHVLALRLTWDWLLLDPDDDDARRRWAAAVEAWPLHDATARPPDDDVTWVAQRAAELAVHDRVAAGLQHAPTGAATGRPEVQVVCCIDVRSEPLRRALEAEGSDVETLGFAGFFGLPAAYLPLGADATVPRLPGPLAPALRVVDRTSDLELAQRRRTRLERRAAANEIRHVPVSAFSYVEAAGLAYAPRLIGAALRRWRPTVLPDVAGLSAREVRQRRPTAACDVAGHPLTPLARTDTAERILRGMSLTRGHAPLVVLLGHGSSTVNNPLAAGLACGACGGHPGDVNARAVAELLNAPEVRTGLRTRGVELPSDTWFVAGLHDTTTDELTLFDTDRAPPTHRARLHALGARFTRASDRVRRERAPRLGLDPKLDTKVLRAALHTRARDWAEVRPEWGLAGNAVLVAAPRAHVRHLDLRGRAFLHDYRADEDVGFRTLELILTAPMVVAHWINFQYYASTVDNRRYGSGDKTLHDVVGGHLGVCEGNGGDLRIGLAWQSLHDGERLQHEPLRLGVFVEAPRDAISAILARHDTVRALADNGWLHLHAVDPHAREVHRWQRGGWVRHEPTMS